MRKKKSQRLRDEGKPNLPKEEEGEEEAILRVGDIHHARCELHDAYIRGSLHFTDGIEETIGGYASVGIDLTTIFVSVYTWPS